MNFGNYPDRNIALQGNTSDYPDRIIGYQWNTIYTSEYILKSQIHQHSLLTRKVFSWHNSSAQVFFSGSTSKLDHHWIIIKAGSSLDHHQSWIMTGSSSKLDHHWIIIKDGSSLDHHHHCFRYLDQLVLSLNSTRHRKFYRVSPFSCWL